MGSTTVKNGDVTNKWIGIFPANMEIVKSNQTWEFVIVLKTKTRTKVYKGETLCVFHECNQPTELEIEASIIGAFP